jgi:hypothetical protein
MKKQTAKHKVLAVFPNALVIEDMDVEYPSEWAVSAKFSVGYFTGPIDVDTTKIFQTTYKQIIGSSSWNFLCGWRSTPKSAWKSAWEFIETSMVKTLEN